MKIAILYVATGRYIAFWEDFYKSCEELFITDAQKTYFVFTDAENIYGQENDNVIKIHQEKLGWPYDTLMRFKMFLTQEEKLKEHDYIFFFNANMKFVQPVGHEVLPDEEHCGFVAGLHPGNYRRSIDEVPYCRNEKSLAYIPYGQGKYYVQGCLNGGTRDAYLEFCHTCMENTQKDLDNGVIAEVHDESHLNKYVLDKNILVLPCNYLYPVGCYYPEYCDDIKIISRDKDSPKYGGTDYLRGVTDKFGKGTLGWNLTYLTYGFLAVFGIGKVRKKFQCKMLRFNKKFI